MRATTVIAVRDQVNHGLHLFFVIAAAVIARNVANQQVLDAPAPAGPESLGKLYIIVALIAGVIVAGVGWYGRNHDARRVASLVHLGVALFMGAAYVLPAGDPYFAIGKYIVMETSAALLLLVFGIMLGARIGPREARRVAARVGAGGIVGGLVAGAVLSVGATFLGSRLLFLIAAALAVAPVFWLPSTTRKRPSLAAVAARDRADVPELSKYGRWVALTTFIMVATTTLIDYEYRYAAQRGYQDNELTAFFGMVVILAGATTIIFQLTALNRLLDKVGLFATATVMPGALIISTAAFGLMPTIYTLVVLKLVDSGANMSVQQATGGLLLAPLSVRARAVWQGRIDGFAKRGGQLATGLFLAVFPWPPIRVIPISLIFCALWVIAILVTRGRYIRLLSAMLNRPAAAMPEIHAYEDQTLRLLERELATAPPRRAAVILDLMEQADHRAPQNLLKRLAIESPEEGALLVIDHLATHGDAEALVTFSHNASPHVAGAALLALDEVDPEIADQSAKRILANQGAPEELRALAAGLMSGHDPSAQAITDELVHSPEASVRLALAQALGRIEPGAPKEVGERLGDLARDDDPDVARTALAHLGKHLSQRACMIGLWALNDRQLRGTAMRTLAELGPPVVKAMADELEKRLEEPAVASALTWAIGQVGIATSLPPLVVALGSAYTNVRLSAAVALNVLTRRRPELTLPDQEIEARYLPEIQFYGGLRDASLAGLPNSPAGTVLRHTLRQRAHASLEILFRLFSLRYPEDAIQGAFAAINSRDRRQRQLALELLDTLLEPAVRQALAAAIGEGAQRSKPREQLEVLSTIAELSDRFLAELTTLVMNELDGGNRPVSLRPAEAGEEGMQQPLVDQILELQSIALFSQASAEDLSDVAAMVNERQVPGNTLVFNEGDPGDAMYLIREGSVVLSRQGEAVDRISAGDAFGIVSVLDRLPREMSATTSGTCTLLVLKSSDLHQLLADRPLLMHSIFRALTSSIRSQLERVSLGKRTTE